MLSKLEQRIIIELSQNRKIVLELSNKTKTVYAWTVITLKKLERQNIVKTKKQGRCRYVSLTKKGKQLPLLINNLDNCKREIENIIYKE